jgi:hypothetical protein
VFAPVSRFLYCACLGSSCARSFSFSPSRDRNNSVFLFTNHHYPLKPNSQDSFLSFLLLPSSLCFQFLPMFPLSTCPSSPHNKALPFTTHHPSIFTQHDGLAQKKIDFHEAPVKCATSPKAKVTNWRNSVPGITADFFLNRNLRTKFLSRICVYSCDKTPQHGDCCTR